MTFQRRHKVPTLYFLAPIVLILVLLLKKKQQKHANNKKLQKHFHNKPWFKKSSDPLFSFFHKSNIAIYINHILSHFSSNIKNTNKLILPLGFSFQNLFQNNKKTQNKSSVNFYPELRGFDPSRVRRQRTLVLPNQ